VVPLIDFIKDCIDIGYYVSIEINRKYIKEYESNFDKNHPILIYGYNLEAKTFYIADFFKNGKYYYAIASFDELLNAYNNVFSIQYIEGAYLYARKKYIMDYEISMASIKSMLYDYLHSLNSHMRNIVLNDYSLSNHKHIYVFGLKIYDLLLELIKIQGEIPLQLLFCFYEHKKVIILLIKYLSERFFLTEPPPAGSRWVRLGG